MFTVWRFIEGRNIIEAGGFTTKSAAETFVEDLEPRSSRCPYTGGLCYFEKGNHVYDTQTGAQ